MIVLFPPMTELESWDQFVALERPLHATYDALRAHILAQDVIGLDQMGWPCLDGKRTKPWQMWGLTTPDAVLSGCGSDPDGLMSGISALSASLVKHGCSGSPRLIVFPQARPRFGGLEARS